MNTIIKLVSGGIATLLFAIVLIPVLRRLGEKFGLTDKPDHRKVHSGNVPVIGGISIFCAILLSVFVNEYLVLAIINHAIIFGSSFILFIIGVLDDRFDLRPLQKLLIQFMCSYFIAISGVRIDSLYGLFGIYAIPVWAEYFLTIVVITGVVNSFNLMDGIDGLIGELSVLGSAILIIISFLCGAYYLAAFYIVLMGALIGFLKFNLLDYNKGKIFMGDAGSLFLGMILVSSSIFFLKEYPMVFKNNKVLLALIIGYFSLPVFDSIRVFLGRMKYGSSPFKADKTHIHHLILLFGVSHKIASIMIILLAILILIAGIIIIYCFSINTMFVVVTAIFSLVGLFLNIHKRVQKWKSIVSEMEK